MKISRPSPALLVSIIALVVACAGTATAAGVIKITSSKQVKNGAITGADIKNGSIHGSDIAKNTILQSNLHSSKKLGASSVSAQSVDGAGGGSATEVVRKLGPDDQTANDQHVVATLKGLPAGTYALFAKTTISASATNQGLGEILRQSKTASAECILDGAGDQDNARHDVAAPYTLTPATLNMQLTRTLAAPGDITVSCHVNDYPWKATDTSIIAIKLASSTKTDVTG